MKPINPIAQHYSFENPPTLFDEEALTALELAARTAGKVNQVVERVNLLDETTHDKLDEQDVKLNAQETYIRSQLPLEVEKEVKKHIENGSYDVAISKYANELEQRVDNLVQNIPEGSTTMDAEVVDIRLDIFGNQNTTAGESVRNQVTQAIDKTRGMVHSNGVESLALTWEPLATSTGVYHWVSKPMPIPVGGVSPRVVDTILTKVGGAECEGKIRTYLGYMVGGEFTPNSELNTLHGGSTFTGRVRYIPYIEGAYFQLRFSLLNSGGTGVLNASNHLTYKHLLDNVKAYTGKVNGGGNLRGATTATIRLTNDAERWKPEWGMNGLTYKFSAVTAPLPLQFVHKVSCNADIWIGAKVFEFDPVTRSTKWAKTLNFNANHPCFGGECVIDFSEWGENHFAILAMGYVPQQSEYGSTGFNGSTSATLNATVMGLNLSRITDGVHVDWAEGAIKPCVNGVSTIVQKNVELLKNMYHKTVPGMYPRDPSESYNYLLGSEKFAGVYYGGGYGAGSFFYHISPATYYAALLNPNSNAYGQSEVGKSGARYGIMCSPFTALCHGYPLPLSVFDYRYNRTIPFFDCEPFDIQRDLHKVNLHDVITYGMGDTGHCVMVVGGDNYGDVTTMLNIMESSAYGTRENVFMLHNGLDYYNTKPEDTLAKNYRFYNKSHTEYDLPLHGRANWVPPYTVPQMVMCSRGYGALYLKGYNRILLSVNPAVNSVTITQDGAQVGEYVVSDMNPESMNGYNVIDITSLVNPGTIRVHNNQDNGVEEFYYMDVSGYTVSAEKDEEYVYIHTNHPEQVKYVNTRYRYADGAEAGDTACANFLPDFDSNGTMKIPAFMVTQDGTATMSAHDTTQGADWKDFVNVIFNTQHDTNTFAIDAQGDDFN